MAAISPFLVTYFQEDYETKNIVDVAAAAKQLNGVDGTGYLSREQCAHVASLGCRFLRYANAYAWPH